MTSHTRSAQDLYELTLSENSWSSFQDQSPESSSNLGSHLSNFQAADATCSESVFPFEASSPPDFIPHDMFLHFADPEIFEPYYGSGRTTNLASPALGEFNGIGSEVNEKHPDLNKPSVSTTLQNTLPSVQGGDGIAEIGARICSLVADHLKRLSGLSSTRATTTVLQAGNDAVSAPDLNLSSHILVDSQGHRASHRSSKAKGVVNSGDKHGRNTILRSRKGRQGDFRCSHPGCTTEPLSSRRNLLRHQKSVHSTPIVLACGTIHKYRRDSFLRHRRNCQKCLESS